MSRDAKWKDTKRVVGIIFEFIQLNFHGVNKFNADSPLHDNAQKVESFAILLYFLHKYTFAKRSSLFTLKYLSYPLG